MKGKEEVKEKAKRRRKKRRRREGIPTSMRLMPPCPHSSFGSQSSNAFLVLSGS